MFKIMGRYKNVEEEIDEADTREDAEFLLDEYCMAYGDGWELWIGEEK
jgi:hypothetical protein